MKRLTLKVDDLSVDSFDTTLREGGARGTVHGRDNSLGGCTREGCGTGYGCFQTNPEDSCATFTQGGDETCINCTARAGTCTEGDYCYEPNTAFACVPYTCAYC